MTSEILTEKSQFYSLFYSHTTPVQNTESMLSFLAFYTYSFQGKTHLIMNFEMFAKALQHTSKPTIIHIPETTSLCDVLCFITQQHTFQSTIEKIHFIQKALELGIPRTEIQEKLLPSLGFDSHSLILKKCLDVAKLPTEILNICHHKQFSLKQCGYLTSYSEDLLLGIIKLPLHTTASTFLEILESIHDQLRKHKITFSEWCKLPIMQETFQSQLSAQELTLKLRTILNAFKQPTLTQMNERLTDKIKKNAIENVHFNWDKTLENKGVSITIHAYSTNDMLEKFKTLSNTQYQTLIEEICEIGS